MGAALRPLSDGTVTLRPSTLADVPVLISGRDETFRRFLGEGDAHPAPTGCIVVDGVVVGWADYDVARPWLEPGEVNIGYSVFPQYRGRGYASRAVMLLMRHLAVDTSTIVATLLIHPENNASLALARRLGFTRVGDLDGNAYWKHPVDAFKPFCLEAD